MSTPALAGLRSPCFSAPPALLHTGLPDLLPPPTGSALRRQPPCVWEPHSHPRSLPRSTYPAFGAQCLREPEESIRSPGTQVTNSCEPPGGPWELDPRPLEDHLVLLSPNHPGPSVGRSACLPLFTVCLSVCRSVCLSVRLYLVFRDRISV